jgi:23S rRNA (pseudouridine1915-N3)-methyltransferase
LKVQLWTIGPTDDKWLKEAYAMYEKRLVHYMPFETSYFPNVKGITKPTPELLKQEEGKRFLTKLAPTDYLVLLDEKGKSFSSVEFSQWMQKRMNSGTQQLVFAMGGAYGFSDQVYEASKEKIALSPMTFNHQMVRLIFIEQLYRAFTILKGEKYHHQ